jgi:hypothetical protein
MKVLILEPELERDLKALVDVFGFKDVYLALVAVCEKKAEEPEMDWGRLAGSQKKFYEGALGRKLGIITQPE